MSNDPVCVFCASSTGSNPVYAEAATSLGKALASSSTTLIYGGGAKGIMGIVSKVTHENGGSVHGVLPRAFLGKGERGEGDGTTTEGMGKTTVVGSMHERKKKMAELATGGFVTLPGGLGTFEELLEMSTWNQLGIHRRKCIVLNVNGFYDSLKTLLATGVSEGFINKKNLTFVRFLDEPAAGTANAVDFDWGKETIKALAEWTWDETAGYTGLDWSSS